MERLEQQNQELLRALQNVQAGLPQAGTAAPTSIIQEIQARACPGDSDAVKKIVDDELAKRDAAKKQEEDAKAAQVADEGYRVGSDMKASASFKDGLFLWMDTPNKDFSMHIGAWFQYDNVWWTQSAALRAAPGSRPDLHRESLPGSPGAASATSRTASTSAASARLSRAPSGKTASTA